MKEREREREREGEREREREERDSDKGTMDIEWYSSCRFRTNVRRPRTEIYEEDMAHSRESKVWLDNPVALNNHSHPSHVVGSYALGVGQCDSSGNNQNLSGQQSVEACLVMAKDITPAQPNVCHFGRLCAELLGAASCLNSWEPPLPGRIPMVQACSEWDKQPGQPQLWLQCHCSLVGSYGCKVCCRQTSSVGLLVVRLQVWLVAESCPKLS